jgi:hypothetical protein
MQSVKDQLEPAEIVFGGLTLTADAIEKLGGLEKAGKLVEEGKFEVFIMKSLRHGAWIFMVIILLFL